MLVYNTIRMSLFSELSSHDRGAHPFDTSRMGTRGIIRNKNDCKLIENL